MTISMLSDLLQFLLMIIFFLVAFSCAFVVLLYRQQGDYVHRFFGHPAHISAWKVVEQLWKAQLNAEPTATDELPEFEEHKGWVGILLVGAFGFFVVVLLLNLLIAVFAKTVDQVTGEPHT
jgi:hypothetical protein